MKHSHLFWPTVALALSAALTAGCATTVASQPRPTQALESAKAAIAAAEASGAGQFAAAELRIAREKLADAYRAADRGQMALAQRTAEQAQADAQLSNARTLAASARASTEKIKGENP